MSKVVLGLSGGVDSAVAAIRLRQQGYEVHGLFMEVGLGGVESAKNVAESLGIPLHIAHRTAQLEEHVCSYFSKEYQIGRTPNPCVVCNPLVKFRALTDYANEIGADYIATGHYACTGADLEGRALLLRSPSEKDQTYMLHRLTRETIARCVFPLGEVPNKLAVRREAEEHEIAVAQKPDSMDICFVPDGDFAGWLEQRGVHMPEGDFVDLQGRVLGRHKGIHHYTVGQRRGLGIAAEGRLFVHAIDVANNRVILALEDVFRERILVQNINYCAPEYAANGAFPCQVRVRYSKKAANCMVYPNGDNAEVIFEKPVRAPAAGQAAVFYDGRVVIGGGFISEENK